MEELAHLDDPADSPGRADLAHLGNGASLAAVRDSHSIDSSMGFTPTAGLPKITRSGELDPGLVSCLARTGDMTPTLSRARRSTHDDECADEPAGSA